MIQLTPDPAPVLQTVCLCMIVKNEAPVIARCLDSVRPLISHWVIVDTGSTDGTQDIIRNHLRDLPGELHERPWKDFAFNRSEALELARPHGDYSLIIDADDALELPGGYRLPLLIDDCYMIQIRDNALAYQRKQLVNNRLHWYYRGVLHEFIECADKHTTGQLAGVVMRRNHDGARRRDPETYRRDAAILERALKTEPDPFLRTRYTFYLAQSYRDCNETEKAIRTYQKRARLGGWQEEVYVSLYQAARLMEKQGAPDDEVIAAYQAATDALPTRGEAIHRAIRFCRTRKLYARGYEIGKAGLALTARGGLFAEPWVYDTGILDEHSINAFWTGHYAESLDACLKALETGKLNEKDVPRVARNARFALDRLAQQGKLPAMPG